MTASDALTPSLEDYLEAIFSIVSEKGAAKARDIARRLRVNNSSVTGALKVLSEKGMVNYAPYDLITLTSKGTETARVVTQKHEVLKNFFIKVLSVGPAEAEDAACKMEHYVSPELFERFLRFTQFVEECPRGGASWLDRFDSLCDGAERRDDCEACITACLKDYRKSRKTGGRKMTMSLNDLKPGERGKILKIRAKGETLRRLSEMGATAGSTLTVERVAPLGDPIDVKVKGYRLSIRKEEAGDIEIEPVV